MAEELKTFLLGVDDDRSEEYAFILMFMLVYSCIVVHVSGS